MIGGNPNSLIRVLERLKNEGVITISLTSSFPFTKYIELTSFGSEIAKLVKDARNILRGILPKDREKLLVYLVHRLGKVDGRTKLIKLLFLLREEFGFINSYNFIPYRYGPYSEEIVEDIHELVSKSVMREESILYKATLGEMSQEKELKRYTLTNIGEQAAKSIGRSLSPTAKKAFARFLKKYRNLSLEELLRYVYSNYPEYATKSEIKKDIVERIDSFDFASFWNDGVISK
jgi:uncharacterized protein YwgA